MAIEGDINGLQRSLSDAMACHGPIMTQPNQFGVSLRVQQAGRQVGTSGQPLHVDYRHVKAKLIDTPPAVLISEQLQYCPQPGMHTNPESCHAIVLQQ